MFRRSALIVVASSCCRRARCAGVDETESRSEFRSAAMAYAPPPPAAGAIFNPAGSFDLFMDLRARAVGDILTILLVERTNASKESSTSTARGSSVDTGFPVIAGVPITLGRQPILNNEMSERHDASTAQADSSQSNRLGRQHHRDRRANGSRTATCSCAARSSSRSIRARSSFASKASSAPSTSGPRTRCSTKVADAAITYSGSGNLAGHESPRLADAFLQLPVVPVLRRSLRYDFSALRQRLCGAASARSL